MEEKNEMPQIRDELAYLRRWEKKYQRLIEEMSDGCVLTRNGRILFANSAAAKMLRCPRAELVGRYWKEFLTPDLAEYIEHTPMVDLPPLFEAHITRFDGSPAILELTVRSAQYEGELAEFTVLRDVTERKRTETEIRRRAGELEMLQATVLDITARRELSALLETIVQRAARLLNTRGGGLYLCDPEQQLARCVVSYNTPQDYCGTVLRYGEGAAGIVAGSGQPLIIDDYRGWPGRADVFEDEQPFTAVLSAPMIWEGQVTGVLHVLDDAANRRFTQSDLDLLILFANHAAIAVENTRLYEQAQSEIDERRRAEKALQRRVAELEALRKASLRLTSSLELKPVLDSLLEQALELSGANDAHIFLYDGERLTLGAARLENGPRAFPLSEPRPEGLTYTVARSGERKVIPDVNADPIFENWQWGGAIVGLPLCVGKRVVGAMNIAFDEPHDFDQNELRLLDLLAAQAAIAIQNAGYYEQVQQHATLLEEEVAARTRELAAANERLQDLERLKSKFITDISHELRTPLTNMRLGLHLLERGQPDKKDEYLAALQAQSGRLIRLVEDILHFSQLDLEKVEFNPVDLNELVEQVVVAHRSRAVGEGVELLYEPDTSLPPVRGQPRQLLRMITELIDNAITYTREGEVHVSTVAPMDGGPVRIQIQDNGIGIAAQDLPYVFERFYRGQGIGSSTIPGAGLGLSIAKEIAEQHGGKIQVNSREGDGSTFVVWLPVA
jgi:PAS domain S-box-containing protein